MLYIYLLKKDDKLVKFSSKKEIINFINNNKVNNKLELVRRINNVDKIMVNDVVKWVKDGNYKLIDEDKVKVRKENLLKKRNDELNNLLN